MRIYLNLKNVTAGNINIKLPEASKFEFDSSLTVGNLSGSFKQKFNGGGARLLVTLTTGNVIIDGK